MKHDFTQENLNELNQLFTQLQPDDNDSIAEQAKSLMLTYSKAFSHIGGTGLLHSIIQSNKDLAEIKRSSKPKLEGIFNEISAQDGQYGQDPYDALVDFGNSMVSLIQASVGGTYSIQQGKIDDFTSDFVLETTSVDEANLNARLKAIADQNIPALVKKVTDADSRDDKELAAFKFAFFCQENYEFLDDATKNRYDEALKQISAQEEARLEALKKKRITEEYQGNTRLYSDYIAEACYLLQNPDGEYDKHYLNNLVRKGKTGIGANPNAKDNAGTNPDTDFVLDTWAQTYFEGWTYGNLHYGSSKCTDIDRLPSKAWRNSVRYPDNPKRKIPTIVDSSYRYSIQKGLVGDTPLNRGELVYYGWNGKTYKQTNKETGETKTLRQSAKKPESITSKNGGYEAAKHMGGVYGSVLLYDKDQGFTFTKNAIIHSQGQVKPKGTTFTDSEKPGKFNRFYLHAESSFTDYSGD